MKCPHCGYVNLDQVLSCKLCGESLRTSEGGERSDSSLSDALAEGRPGFRPVGGPRLLCPPMPPMPLRRDREFVLGRGETCDLMLSSGLISRRHAVVRWRNGAFAISDDESVNGTFLNGELLKPQDPVPLATGDKVAIGPFTIRFTDGDPSQEEAVGAGDDTTKLPARGKPIASIEGDLHIVSLRTILEEAAGLTATGTLRIDVEDGPAWIMIDKGEPHSAMLGDRHGVDALRELLNLRAGHFRLEPPEPNKAFPAGEREFNLAMTKIMLKAHDKQIDVARATTRFRRDVRETEKFRREVIDAGRAKPGSSEADPGRPVQGQKPARAITTEEAKAERAKSKDETRPHERPK